ncbi:hypothetical protein ASD8599_03935 [Ascidiaceihabitans donghaensis]|uniref:Uncharacterized protein n=1 Tax=Ascidiaceihabitans donghaensis TaxID=1510460 RepID=A0A2R8BPD7_9RHOB|nr:hypothetical protein [Ascidiaceihabitans donghaensis]SPH27469.1 hypothetical protein ASD8599_03935 [Ascidiaceihabitans donghaensis]
MFAITPAHEAGFEDYRRERFIEELALGSYDFIADDAPFLTKDQRLKGARFIYQSAENAGYETRGGCFFWLNMAVLFGSHFSSDPQFGIIAPRHGQTGGSRELADLSRVYTQVANYVSQVLGGPSNRIYNAAVAEFVTQMDDVHGLQDLTDAASVSARLSALYPQKQKSHGRVYLGKLDSGAYQAKALRLFQADDMRTVYFVAAMEMFFGHQFETDFFKPWIGAAIAECGPSGTDGPLDVRPLTKQVKLWVDNE